MISPSSSKDSNYFVGISRKTDGSARRGGGCFFKNAIFIAFSGVSRQFRPINFNLTLRQCRLDECFDGMVMFDTAWWTSSDDRWPQISTTSLEQGTHLTRYTICLMGNSRQQGVSEAGDLVKR